MFAPPPPPPMGGLKLGPPGPPPPPMGGLKLGAPAGKSSGGGDPRSALLQSIQKGTTLKKTTTVDKSGPALSGRVTNATNSNSSNSNSNTPTRPSLPTNAQGPALGGIFGDMKAMPKLKPVGARNNVSKSPPSESPSSAATMSNANNARSSVLDFNAELTKHLTLKKQKKQQQQQQQQDESNSSVSESNSRVNRGPPPQPPNKNPTTTVTDNNVKSTAAQSTTVNKQSNSSTPVMSPNGTPAAPVPNKSSLFPKAEPSAVTNNADANGRSKPNNIAVTATTTNKVVPNHGKPNCAPKPPGIHQLIATKGSPNNTVKSNANNDSNTRISRHESMRSPRSPPITAPGSTFPAMQQFGTMRGAPMAFKSQDGIHIAGMQPAPSRPTVAPPRPPIEAKNQPIPPPPPPNRSVSNTNLTALSLSVSSGIKENSTTNFGGSAGNVSTLPVNSVSAANSGSGNIAPPLPPYRMVPPPPPARITSIATNNNSAPPVPQRHSSMRDSSFSVESPVSSSAPSFDGTQRYIVDIDAKFGHAFHNVNEFPPPAPFKNLKNGISVGL